MKRLFPLAALTLVLGAGCQQFFTQSIAEGLARSPQKIKSFTPDTAAAFVASLAGNPDPAQARAAMGAMGDLVAANPTDAEVLADASLVAVMATGLDAALTQAITQIDPTAFQGGTLDPASLASIAALITGVSGNVSPDCVAVFDALAAQAAADPASLVDSGIGAQTFVVAAAALVIADIQAWGLAPLADVLAGTAIPAYDNTVSNPTLASTLTNLAAGATAADPGNALLAALQGMGLLQP